LKLGQVKQVTDYRDNLFRDVATGVSPENSRQNTMAVVVHNTRAKLSMRFKNLCSDNCVGLVPITFNGSVVEDEEIFLHEFSRRIYGMFISDEYLREDIRYNPTPRAGLVTFFVKDLKAFREKETGKILGLLKNAIQSLIQRLAEKLSTKQLRSAHVNEDVAIQWRRTFPNNGGYLQCPGKMDFALYVNYLLPKVQTSVILIEIKDREEAHFNLPDLQFVEDRDIFFRPTQTRSESDAELLYSVNVEPVNWRENRLEINVDRSQTGLVLKENKEEGKRTVVPYNASGSAVAEWFIEMLVEKLEEMFEDDFEIIEV